MLIKTGHRVSVAGLHGTAESVGDWITVVRFDDGRVADVSSEHVQRAYTVRPRLIKREVEGYCRPWFENRDLLEQAVNRRRGGVAINLGFSTSWAAMSEEQLNRLHERDPVRWERWFSWEYARRSTRRDQ